MSTLGTSGAPFRRNVARMSNRKRSRRFFLCHPRVSTCSEGVVRLFGASGKTGGLRRAKMSFTPYKLHTEKVHILSFTRH